MKKLPDSEIYEQELTYMPYKDSLKKVLEIISKRTPKDGSLLDLMSGTGYLLDKIAQKRKDITLHGVDIDKRYITFSKKEYPIASYEVGDVLKWKTDKLYDVAICTGSLHHIPYGKQEKVIIKMAKMIKPKGFVLISDCYIDDYSNETERKVAAAKLGHEYLRETIENGAPKEVVEETVNIMYNDVMMDEFKTSVKKRVPILKKHFKKVESFKTWPKKKTEYGDYIHVCRN